MQVPFLDLKQINPESENFVHAKTFFSKIGIKEKDYYDVKKGGKLKETEEGKEKTADLKEALTVLLNLEFRNLWVVEDAGYEVHKELRNFITNKWNEEKDFDILIQKCITHLKD